MTGAARVLDATALADWARAAVDALIAHVDEINRLNVFPVADADTGTNMLFTLRAAAAALPDADAADLDAADLAAVAAALATGAAHGARGNSGVILSQILRGLSDAAATEPPPTQLDAATLATAFGAAVALVVDSMGELVPGTIVSVLQAAAETMSACAAAGAPLPAAVTDAADAAAAALERTPSQLDVLADAGVVDAGGRGLLVLLDTLVATLTGTAPARRHYEPARHDSPATVPPAAAPRFEVMYRLAGCTADAVAALRRRLAGLGDSVAITTDADGGHSVHVHADDAGGAVEAGLPFGAMSHVQITTLTGGAAPGQWAQRQAVLALADGDGAEQLFAGEGAYVLRPQVSDHRVLPVDAAALSKAVVDSGAGQLMILPNGLVAAEELVAACATVAGWGVDVVPLPTDSMVQGLAALAVHDPERNPVENSYTMARAAAGTRHASVRRARERALSWAGACEPGDALGVAGDEVLVIRSTYAGAAQELVDILLAAGGGELVTVLVGAELGDDEHDRLRAELDAHMRRHHPGTEWVLYRTGHHGDDALLIGIE
ncbi:DAK2 domain-containing protein [Mycobacterium sp. MYCO198283]|uniref:DAK2 domain-containing protein n=1 Tax=Mycobacterium sp. MYCO198283 TaxID=2883505 RepID=UPI001E2CA222|nr:DAK2 domain-containing protein [Mycobacterium sp. MYCO198283]MCG5433708.1 DAK2 domain-containing protein [Mycobacterium sp. MYCO198283]